MSWPGDDFELEVENELRALRKAKKAAEAFLAAWGEQGADSAPPDNVLDAATALRVALNDVPEPST